MARAGKKRARRWTRSLQHRDAFAGIFHMSLVRHVSIARHVVVRTGRTLAGRTKRAPACSLPVSVCLRIPVSMGHLQPHSCLLALCRGNLLRNHILCLPPRTPIPSNPVHRHFAFSGLRCSATLAKHTAALFDSTPTWRWAVNCDLSLLLQPYS